MDGSFLQTPEWEEVHRAMGRKTWRPAGTLLIRYRMPGGFNYLYCPRPLFDNTETTGACSEFFSEAAKIARQERSIYLKIDPREHIQALNSPITISDPLQPRCTAILDLGKSEEDLLMAMHEKTRYNIRLAQKHGVTILSHVSGDRTQDTALFLKLLGETARREGFHLHEPRYYELLAAIRKPDISNELFFACRDGIVVAAAMVNFHRHPQEHGGTATYLHGASLRSYNKLMAPHLLHWRIIQEAKRRGCDAYDFWGIDEKKWPGLTRFKLGFRGRVVTYPPSIDIVFRPFWYASYRFLRRKRHNNSDL